MRARPASPDTRNTRVLAGMNAEVDEAAEERKGGAGHLGKMLLSAGDKQVRLCAGRWRRAGWQSRGSGHHRYARVPPRHNACAPYAQGFSVDVKRCLTSSYA